MSLAGASLRTRRLVFAAAGACVLAVFCLLARSGMLEDLASSRKETYYNLLVRGFGSGRLSLARDVPAGLARLPDPFDPAANMSWRLGIDGVHDLSYFRGRLYLYFGPTPALVLFGPAAALTGHYLHHREAALLFCFLAFLIGAGLLRSAWRRYFPEVGAGVAGAAMLVFGLCTGLPMLLARSDVYEVAIACGCFFVTLAWAGIWRALHRPERRGAWLALASAAFGLALGARPSLLAGALVLLAPWAPKPRRRRPLLCALAPIGLIGAGLLAYNWLRFGSVLEFGQHFQLASDRQDTASHFSPANLWFNFRAYFLQPAAWHGHFPFVHRARLPAPPAGHGPVEDPFGAFANVPVLLLAFAVPLAWRGRRALTANLRRFALALVLAFAAPAVTLCLFYGSCSRYEAEFLPALGFLAALGLLAAERTLAACRGRQILFRLGWGVLLAVSLGFNLLGAVEHAAEAGGDAGMALADAGRLPEGIALLRQAVRLDPELVGARVNLGAALARSRRLPEAITEFSTAVRLDPVSFEGQFSLGQALEESGSLAEAIPHYSEAARLRPDLADPRYRLANALGNAGRLPEAAAQYAEALRIQPGHAAARANLGLALAEMDRTGEAIAQLEQALRDRPDSAEAEAYLGFALARAGRWEEATAHYERALARNPANADLRYQLEMARRHRRL